MCVRRAAQCADCTVEVSARIATCFIVRTPSQKLDLYAADEEERDAWARSCFTRGACAVAVGRSPVV